MSFDIGSTVDGYEFLDVLSSSKTEIRYRVRNILAQRTEVLRLLPKNLQEDQERVERFLREMKVHARLAHPNIVAFYHAADLRGQFVMTTELVEGVTLAERFASGRLSCAEAVGLALQALAALACAHAQGIVHRDIAPQHMLVTPEGTLKIGGFGLAKASASPLLTQDGAVLGTLRYISPEQVKGSSAVDARSDLYSLGVILYEAVAGKPPFDSKSQFELMLAHVAEAPRPPRDINPEIPPELERIILTAIAKQPEQRFQSADEFRRALEGVKAALEKPVAAAHPEPATPAPPPQAAAAAPAPIPEVKALPAPAPVPPAQIAPAAVPVARPMPPFTAEPFAGTPLALFGQPSAASWDAKQLTIIVSAAMALFFFFAYLLVRHG